MRYYLLYIWSDVEPRLLGPYKNEAERDKDYEKRSHDDPYSGYYNLNADGKVSIERLEPER